MAETPLPSLRGDARTIAWWLSLGLVVGGIVGGLVGGVGGRLVMLVLRLSSDADGVVSDDGFTIGSFTLFDSLQLYAGMALFGAVNGLCYVGARQLLPRRFRVALWGAVGAAVVGRAIPPQGGDHEAERGDHQRAGEPAVTGAVIVQPEKRGVTHGGGGLARKISQSSVVVDSV